MNTYTGLHARRYDVVYADKPYAEEARFVDALVREAGVAAGRLLDVACGTGRHAAEFSVLGWDVTGVDLSQELLEHARLNAPSARFLEQDMRELDLAGERFNAVTCLFDSIGYPVDDEGVLASLAGFRTHLAPGGAVVIEFLHAPALIRDASPLKARRIDLSEGDALLRLSRTTIDEERSVMEVEFELLELRSDGTYARWVETQRNRFFDVAEMEHFLGQVGLRMERAVPAYQGSAEISADTFHVIAVARSAE